MLRKHGHEQESQNRDGRNVADLHCNSKTDRFPLGLSLFGGFENFGNVRACRKSPQVQPAAWERFGDALEVRQSLILGLAVLAIALPLEDCEVFDPSRFGASHGFLRRWHLL